MAKVRREIIEKLSRKPITPLFSVPKILQGENSALKKIISKQMDEFDLVDIEEVLEDPMFKFLRQDSENLEKDAREWLLIQIVEIEIKKLRAVKLKKQNSYDRPQPYDHDVFSDLKLRSDFLVSVDDIEVRFMDNALIKDGVVFTMAPSTNQLNSSYWLLNELNASGLKRVFLRLDPLIFEHAEDITFPAYKMWVYGQPHNWEQIRSSKEEIHGRWMPEESYKKSEMTEFVWTPRSDEIHFTCEEVPKKEDLQFRGSRYFHAIYSKKKKCFTHLDGAIRYFEIPEWSQRMNTHIRKSDKIGKRVKLFLVDEDISIEIMSNLCANFFVWNDDVINYFN